MVYIFKRRFSREEPFDKDSKGLAQRPNTARQRCIDVQLNELDVKLL
jgi:hypothetical protein